MDGAEACDGLEVSFVGVLGGDTKVEVDEEEGRVRDGSGPQPI